MLDTLTMCELCLQGLRKAVGHIGAIFHALSQLLKCTQRLYFNMWATTG